MIVVTFFIFSIFDFFFYSQLTTRSIFEGWYIIQAQKYEQSESHCQLCPAAVNERAIRPQISNGSKLKLAKKLNAKMTQMYPFSLHHCTLVNRSKKTTNLPSPGMYSFSYLLGESLCTSFPQQHRHILQQRLDHLLWKEFLISSKNTPQLPFSLTYRLWFHYAFIRASTRMKKFEMWGLKRFPHC